MQEVKKMMLRRRTRSIHEYVRVLEEILVRTGMLILSIASLAGIVLMKVGYPAQVLDESKAVVVHALAAMLTAMVVALIIGAQSRQIAAAIRKMSGTLSRPCLKSFAT